MKTLGILVVFAAVCCVTWGRIHGSSHQDHRRSRGRHHEKQVMLETNKIPVRREPLEISNNDVEDNPFVESLPSNSLMDPCEECKSIVTRIDNIIKNPAKLAELKVVLDMACNMAPASYRNECKEIVQNVDDFAHELEPLLSNPEALCREIHLCGGGRKS